MSEQVKRYDPEGYSLPASVSGTGTHMVENAQGDYVLSNDYDALAQRCRELEAERTKLRSTLAAIPTAEAYDAACAALWKHRDDAEALRATLTAARDKLGPAVRNGHPALTELAASEVLEMLEAACADTAGDTPSRI